MNAMYPLSMGKTPPVTTAASSLGEVDGERGDLLRAGDRQQVDGLASRLAASRLPSQCQLRLGGDEAGQMAFTRTPSLAMPAANERVTPTTPPLAAV